MARLARKQLADMRAMEEEAERHNPLSGSGATPSMGLSQFRGGKSVAHKQGSHLAKHLHSLHGKEFHDDFMEGMGTGGGELHIKHGGAQTGRYEGEGKLHGGFWGALASAAIPLISSLFGKGHLSKEAHDVLCEHMEGKGKYAVMDKRFGPGGEEYEKMMARAKTMPKRGGAHAVGGGKLHITHGESDSDEGEMEGAGPISNLGIPLISNLAGMFGLGDEKKAKRVVGAGDGRRKRAEIVKKVMREKGMKMIEASKYVKEHGLYK